MRESLNQGQVQTDSPTSYNDGDFGNILIDKLGRQVITQHHVREMLVTAIADLVDGTNTTFLAGDSENYLDLVYLTAANESDASIQVTLTEDGTTVHTLELGGNRMVEMNPSAPIPQSAKGGDWQIQLEDVTGTTIHIEALFIKNQ